MVTSINRRKFLARSSIFGAALLAYCDAKLYMAVDERHIAITTDRATLVDNWLNIFDDEPLDTEV